VTTRRAFLGALTSGLFAAVRVAEAQQTEKVYRIGYLAPNSAATAFHVTEPFRQGLRELGWVEGPSTCSTRTQ